MAVDQLPGRVREFANYLDGLLGRLDQGGGWCGVFWHRDPEGMRACLDGYEMPPWDVVEALLQDLAAAYGPPAAVAERERARTLYGAAVSAYDALPGARDALGDRLDVMLREQRYAAERHAELSRLFTAATSHQEADVLRLDIAWARDDHERATARCTELRDRVTELDRRAVAAPILDAPVAGGGRDGGEPDPDGSRAPAPDRPVAQPGAPAARRTGSATDPASRPGVPDPGSAARSARPAAQPAGSRSAVLPTAAPVREVPPPPAPEAPAPGKPRKRRRGSARFAGMAEEEAAPVVVPQSSATAVPDASGGRRTPRGARFAGAAETGGPVREAVEAVDSEAGAAVAGAVERLVRLRAEGRTGEAHVLLVEITHWPAARFPLLADGLQRAGLGADWATLLWEAASLPAERLVAAADALEAAGRAADGEQMLRQGVARPAEEIGAAVRRLDAEGRAREVRALLDAYVRVRTPEEAARSVAADPRRLVPLLLEAARGVSEERHWDLVHALRVAGFTA
ncbi:hypothetical protein ACIRU3_28580 [Streptomyces sp. NPDC101151]|uniref:hypothetical protein n=1 Tax=Streptomyces sp. NPDC101151 TaxID=3366115 RepID=UPI0038020912